jgi:hypothetical protein
LVILPTICYTPKMHAQCCLPSMVSHTHSLLYCLPFVIVRPSLQIVAFKFSLASYHHIIVTTFLWQLIASYSKGYFLIHNLAPFCKKNTKLWKKGSNTLYNLKLYYFPCLLIKFKCLQNTSRPFLNHFPLESHTSINTFPTTLSSLVYTIHFSKRVLYSKNQLQAYRML